MKLPTTIASASRSLTCASFDQRIKAAITDDSMKSVADRSSSSIADDPSDNTRWTTWSIPGNRRQADILCDRPAKSLRAPGVGRPAGSASAPDRREPPRVVLRAIKRDP